MNKAIILFGSNIEPQSNLEATRVALRDCTDIRIIDDSSVYESPTILISGEKDVSRPPFHNVAFLVETMHDWRGLHTVLRQIETQMGRKRMEDKFADRTVDLDILLLSDGGSIEEADRDVWKHAYATLPAADVAPDWVIGSYNQNISEIATEIKQKNIQTWRIK